MEEKLLAYKNLIKESKFDQEINDLFDTFYAGRSSKEVDCTFVQHL